MHHYKITSDIEIKPIAPENTAELFAMVNKNREHLKTFLPWLDMNTKEEHTRSFIDTCVKQYEKDGSIMFAVFYQGNLVGMNGFHPIHKANLVGSIGYWLDQDHCGKGITTKVVKKIIDFGFRELNLNRIEINCATENIGSNQVAKKMGLKYEGTRRQVEWLYDRFVDHNCYSILRSEYSLKS